MNLFTDGPKIVETVTSSLGTMGQQLAAINAKLGRIIDLLEDRPDV
jgi:hypothetical protein